MNDNTDGIIDQLRHKLMLSETQNCEKMTKAEARIKELRMEITALNEDIEIATTCNDDVNTKLKNYNNKVTLAEARIQDLEANNFELTRQIEKVTNSSDGIINELTNKLMMAEKHHHVKMTEAEERTKKKKLEVWKVNSMHL
mmetsp:Transcript_60078/g.71471  ORF Transcript_60078/g.71471 Transcript_60078/m.71471 type:complete len:142 (-) Transcript_60078:107-532(-)